MPTVDHWAHMDLCFAKHEPFSRSNKIELEGPDATSWIPLMDYTHLEE